MSVGPFGYPDGQRVQQQDASTPAWSISGTFTTTQTSPVIPTQGFAYSYIYSNLSAGGAAFGLSNFLDSLGTQLIGTKGIVLDSLGLPVLQATIPNLGPYIFLAASVLPGKANFVGSIIVLLTNKSKPYPALPASDLWSGTGASIPASGSRAEYAPFYHGGPASIITVGGSQATNFTLAAEDTSGTWRSLYASSPGALVVANTIPVTLPLAPLRMTIGNGSGAGADAGWQFTVTPDLSAT